MKKEKFLGLLLLAFVSFVSFSCSDDDDETPTNEDELITTVKVKLVEGTNEITFEAKDLDGEGPGQTVYTPATVQLATNKTYSGEVQFLDESKNPVDDITEEVVEEALEHQVFYASTGTLGTVAYNLATGSNNTDSNGRPIGIKFTLTTGSTTGAATLKVTLRHEPNKAAAGVATGDITNAGGSTDAEVTFTINVQ